MGKFVVPAPTFTALNRHRATFTALNRVSTDLIHPLQNVVPVFDNEGVTAQVFTQLLAQLDSLDDDGLMDALAQAESELRAAQAVRAAVIRSVCDRIDALGYPISGATETVAAITVVSSRSADHLMDTSISICERSAVWEALMQGVIDLSKARLVSESFSEVPADVRDELEQRCLAYAATHTTFQTRRHVTRLLVNYDPSLDERNREREKKKAWEGRHLSVMPRGNGMADVYGCVPLGTALMLDEALDEAAGAYNDDRTMDQKRVDALGEILNEIVHLDVQVTVVIPADTLAGLQEAGASVEGFGPIAGEYGRYLSLQEDARWRRLIADPVTGVFAELSTSAYRIPDALKRGVRARDHECRFPGCATPAARTDTDHVVPWPAGLTASSNLVASCRRHHRVKTFSAWKCSVDDQGVVSWTSPLGSVHQTAPWDYLSPTG